MLLTSTGGLDAFVQFITVLLIFVFVLVITLYVTRWIAKVQKGVTSGKNIEIIETMRISSTQYIQIVKIAEEYMAIGVSKDNISMLTKLDESKIVACDDNNQDMSFSEVFAKLKNSVTNKEITSENSDESN